MTLSSRSSPAVAQQRTAPGTTGGVELAVLDGRGVIVAVNDEWRRYGARNGGDPSAAGPGVSYLEVCDAAADPTATEVATVIRAVLAGDQVSAVGLTIPCAGPAGPRWFDLGVFPRLDDDGRTTGCSVTLTPADTAVGGSAGRTASARGVEPSVWTLLEQLPDAAVLVDARGTICYLNRQLERVSGYPRAELLGHDVQALVPGGLRARHRSWRRIRHDAQGARAEAAGGDLALLRKGGGEVPVEIASASVGRGGHDYVLASIRDVTERRAEDRARQQLLQMLDLVDESVFVVDAGPEATIEYASGGACRLLGYTREELTSMSWYEVSPEATDRRRRDILAEHRSAGPGHVHAVEALRRAKDGTDIVCDTRGQVVSAPGAGQKFLVVDRDARPRRAHEAEERRRLDLARLVVDVDNLVLSDAPPETVYAAIAEGAARLVASENASLVLEEPPGELVTVAAVGPAATRHRHGRVRLDPSTLSEWLTQATPQRLAAPPVAMPGAIRDLVGPGLVVPFRGPGDLHGLLTTFRARGREPFTVAEQEVLAELARQLGVGLALGHARASRHRLELLEERQRIARDLHDTVLQDVIGLGLQLTRGSEGTATQGSPVTPTDALLDQLEKVARDLRLVIFETRTEEPTQTFRRAVTRTVLDAARALGHEPSLTLTGPLDALPPDVERHLVAVLREALSNVARHAGASATTVTLTRSGTGVTLRVRDDGEGLPGTRSGGDGIANIDARAIALGGTASVRDADGGGVEVVWEVPLS